MSLFCDRLDDFLERALLDEDRAAFAAHLVSCSNCRHAVEEHERCNLLLRQAVLELQRIPEGISERARRRIQAEVRRQYLGRAAALAAAALLLAAGIRWLTLPVADEEIVASPRTRAALTKEPPEPDPRSLVRVSFGKGSDVIGVPMKTANSNVTILWVYPAIRTAGIGKSDPPNEIPVPERNGT